MNAGDRVIKNDMNAKTKKVYMFWERDSCDYAPDEEIKCVKKYYDDTYKRCRCNNSWHNIMRNTFSRHSGIDFQYMKLGRNINNNEILNIEKKVESSKYNNKKINKWNQLNQKNDNDEKYKLIDNSSLLNNCKSIDIIFNKNDNSLNCLVDGNINKKCDEQLAKIFSDFFDKKDINNRNHIGLRLEKTDIKDKILVRELNNNYTDNEKILTYPKKMLMDQDNKLIERITKYKSLNNDMQYTCWTNGEGTRCEQKYIGLYNLFGTSKNLKIKDINDKEYCIIKEDNKFW